MTVWEWSHVTAGWRKFHQGTKDGPPKAPTKDRLAELTDKWGA